MYSPEKVPEHIRVIHVDDLKVILESAAEKGALAALSHCGLKPEDREHIVAAIVMQKNLKEAKKEAFKELGRWLIRIFTLGAVVALAAKFGLNIGIKP